MAHSQLGELGRGSFGVVEAVIVGGRRVARKRLRSDCRNTPKYRARLRREAEIMQQLRHPNIMPILDAELDNSDPWFAMPAATGSLANEVVAAVGLSLESIRELFSQILDAVEYAHREGVIHRDLSPSNILMINDRVVVTDFGLGRTASGSRDLTSLGEKGGTLGYTAPEQLDDLHGATEQSDIYSLGSLLLFMATGRYPMAVTRDLQPERFRHIVLRCRREDPSKRYSSVAELRADFDAVWRPETDAMPPKQQANILLAANEPAQMQIERLVDLYLRHWDDEALYKDTLPLWSDDLLERVEFHDPEAFREIIVFFDRHVSGQLQFSYVDKATNFLAQVYRLTGDEDLRISTLERILVMGAQHNRFHARRTFWKIVEGASMRVALLVRQILFAHPSETKWAAEEQSRRNIPPLVLDTIDAIIGIGPRPALPAPREPARLAAVASRQRFLPMQKVIHPKFGRGSVVDVADRGSDQEVVVEFHGYGRKHLLASFANFAILE
ncbi:MAG: serine/threonine-protein kinase [Thermomicrobiales bacterium]